MAESLPLGIGRPSLALSPDGSQLVYVVNRQGQRQLYLRPMGDFAARPLPGTEGAFQPFFSPDGEWVGFFTPTELKKIAIRGGAPVTLCDAGNVVGASWGTDGEIVFADREGGQLSRVSANGGTPEVVLRPDLAQGEFGFLWPQVLPEGHGVLLTLFKGLKGPSIAVVSLDTGERRMLIERGSGAHYVPTGHLVHGGEGGILAVPFDLSSLTVTGSAIPVLEDVRREVYGVPQLTLSADGSLAYVQGGNMAVGSPVWVDRNGVEEQIPLPPRAYGMFGVSPDGTRLAIQVNATTSDVLLYDFERATAVQRLTVEGNNASPVWTADGERVTFASDAIDQSGVSGMSWQRVDGGLMEPLLVDAGLAMPLPSSWSTDGMLAFAALDPETTSQDIWVMSIDDAPNLEPFVQTPASEWGAVFSPDGNYIAYTSDESGQYEVHVIRYPPTAERWLVSTGYGEEPVWSSRGDELFFRRGNEWLAARG